jgi:phage terminase large subunit-like protein
LIASGVVAKVQGYIDGVLDGQIITSKSVVDAVRRHVDDLQRQSSTGFAYHFDHKWATKVCQFFPLMLRHSIGEFAGRPFELEDWQAFAIWSIFGWKRDDDNSRRFRKVYWSMGRKNGKSSIAAGLCHYLAMGDIDPKTGKPEAVGQILLTATKKEQAKVVYGEADRMRLQSPTIKKMTETKYETITYKHNQSYIRMVSSDKPFDGLNPHCVVMDELHAWGEHHRSFYDTMVTGSGSRSQPLHLIITTAGSDNSHLWKENYEYAKHVLAGNFRDESLFAIIYELDESDDPSDQRNWIKANPNLGVSCSLEYLRQRWNEDKNTAIGRNRFMRYHGNRIVSATEKAFDLQAFDKCVGEFSDWSQADATGAGVDLGARDDLAAYALCARFPIGTANGSTVYRYEIRSQAFISNETKRNLSIQPFAEWIHDGQILKSSYPIADLESRLREELERFEIQTIAYDPYNGQQLGENLTKFGVVAARMAQNQANFNEAIRDFLQLMEEGRLVFGASSLLRWCASNAVICKDRQDRWMFDKKTSAEKIDPIVAAVMAYRICSLQPERSTGSLYVV